MKKGELFEFYFHETDYERFCQVDVDGVNEEEVRLMLADLYRVDQRDIRINLQPLCTVERWEMLSLSNLWRVRNLQKGVNEYEGLPPSAFIKEFAPSDIYRLMLDKKNNELEIVLKNGNAVTLSVEAERMQKQLALE